MSMSLEAHYRIELLTTRQVFARLTVGGVEDISQFKNRGQQDFEEAASQSLRGGTTK